MIETSKTSYIYIAFWLIVALPLVTDYWGCHSHFLPIGSQRVSACLSQHSRRPLHRDLGLRRMTIRLQTSSSHSFQLWCPTHKVYKSIPPSCFSEVAMFSPHFQAWFSAIKSSYLLLCHKSPQNSVNQTSISLAHKSVLWGECGGEGSFAPQNVT